MAPPQFTDDLPGNVFLRRNGGGGGRLPGGLIDLLRTHRENYAWPFNTTPASSQQEIINIECAVGEYTNHLTVQAAYQIVVRVSIWARNRRHNLVVDANDHEKVVMFESIQNLLVEEDLTEGLSKLSDAPGVSLVLATKVSRFCRTMAGAAVDRHASYFFNSLRVISDDAPATRSTEFRRQWVRGVDGNSRLATFTQRKFSANLNEYAAAYLPLLREIADALNAAGIRFMCAATGIRKTWTSSDVEMAAFYWWALNGSR